MSWRNPPTLAAIEARYDAPVVFAPDAASAARSVERWAYWYARELNSHAGAMPKPMQAEPANA